MSHHPDGWRRHGRRISARDQRLDVRCGYDEAATSAGNAASHSGRSVC
jgi:hypothetical protein